MKAGICFKTHLMDTDEKLFHNRFASSAGRAQRIGLWLTTRDGSACCHGSPSTPHGVYCKQRIGSSDSGNGNSQITFLKTLIDKGNRFGLP